VFGHPTVVPALHPSKSKRQSCPCDPAWLGTPFQCLLAILACSDIGCRTHSLGIGNTLQKNLAGEKRLDLAWMWIASEKSTRKLSGPVDAILKVSWERRAKTDPLY